MKKSSLIPTAIVLLSLHLPVLTANDGLAPLLVNVHGRQSTSLNGSWDYIVDRYGTGYYDYRRQPKKDGFFMDRHTEGESDLVEYNFDASPKMQIPHDWNTWTDELKYYEGIVWFRKTFDFHKEEGKRYFLYFGAVNYKAVVHLNGQYLGEHEGGFTPFDFEIGDRLKEGKNTLVVMVDNTRKLSGVPTVNTDWWNYGGITRDVLLVTENETFISDYEIGLGGYESGNVSVRVRLDGAEPESVVSVDIPELDIHKEIYPDFNGNGRLAIMAGVELWSPENPKLYKVFLTCKDRPLADEIAFRRIAATGNKVYLNGEPVYLRGVCIHEEAPFRQGRPNSTAEAHTLLTWAKEMNCNFVRLAHYPHNEYMVREAERMGIMVWDEIPVYWTIDFGNEETLQNAKNQLKEMITRDRNRGAVVIWSLANETPVSDQRNTFLRAMAGEARKLDDSRLISMAMEKQYRGADQAVVSDPLMDAVDVVSFNTYIGWYDGPPEKCDDMNWEVKTDKPVIVSEFGGGAQQGYHGRATQRWTEEFQAAVYTHNLAMFDKMDLAGTTPWILMDFRSPRRMLPVIQDGFNRKGLISDQGQKKKAFYIMQSWYGDKMGKQ